MRALAAFARVAAALLLALSAGTAGAATYTFPTSMPSGCSGSGGSYTCSSTVKLGSSDSIVISGTKPATIRFNQDFEPSGSAINLAGSASDLTIIVSGRLRMSTNTRIVANITAGEVRDDNGNNTITGSITNTTGDVGLSSGTVVNGSITTSSGSITLGSSTTVTSCVKSTSSASITLGSSASVGSVCCGSASCSTSCVTNNSGRAMPSTCGSTPTLTSGQRYSFESYDLPGYYIRHRGFQAYTDAVTAGSGSLTLYDATFIARPGLANSSCWSFEALNYPGYYLRHSWFYLVLNVYASDSLYANDATFCLRSGLASSSALSLESINYPGYYLRHNSSYEMVLTTQDGTATQKGQATFNARSPWVATSPDHYELHQPSTAVSCLPSTLTVKACSDSATPCTTPMTTLAGHSVTLAAGAGSLASATLTFDATGIATTTWTNGGAANASSASVTLSGETAPATNSRRCCPDGTSCTTANSCSTTFSSAGFIVAASAGGAATTLPTQTAGTGSATYYLRAVKTNTTTKACESALSGTTTVNWALQCTNPTTCSSGNLMTLTGAAAATIASNPASAITSSTAVSMTFDANGNAPFSFSYADVGQVLLQATKTVNSASLSGTSNAFVVKPASLSIGNVRQTASPNLANPAAASAGGSVFVKAGEAFSATVTALTSGGAATPNFGRETSPEGVTLTPTLVLPSPGTAGTLSNGSIAGGSFSSGAATATTLAYSEVGIITLTPSLTSGSYLGAGAVSGTASGNIGRFVPARFALSGTSATHRSGLACSPASTFSYLGENLRLGLTLTAQNAMGGTTTNYAGSFAKLDPTSASAWNLAGRDGSTVFTVASGRLSLGSATGSWSAGVAAGVTLTATPLRAASPDGPFSAAFGVAPADSDGVALASFDMASTSGGANDRAQVGTLALRFGRLRLSNAIGAADRTLGLPAVLQHWNGSAWATNTLDSCTSVPTTAMSFGNLTRTLTVADTAATQALAFSAGQGTLRLAAPGGGRSGTYDVALSLGSTAADASCLQPWTPGSGDAASAGASLAHLRGAWCGSSYANDPAARAAFGLQRTQEHLVYRRENY